MSTKQPSKVIFIGNIPYGLSEEQITDIFSSAGKVLNFRLVYDRETAKPKGFGFLEYPDIDTASSAVRNLDNYDIMNRKLRVDFSNEPGSSKNDNNDDNVASAHNTDGGVDQYGRTLPSNADPSAFIAANGSALPPLPAGKELPPGVTCSDAISRTLNTLPPSQLLDILSSMKTLSTTDPARAVELLNQAPQLSYAIFQALLLMGLVSPEAINAVLDSGPPAVATPPVANAPYAAPPPPVAAAPAPTPAAASAGGGQDNDALLAQVMALPQEVIDALPAGERDQLMALRAQHAAAAR